MGLALAALVVSCGQDVANGQPLDETRRLAGLCQVWGLLKYFHPGVAQRESWDDVLTAAVPRVRAAASQEEFNREILALINEADFRRGARGDTPLDPRSRWIDDPTLFLPETTERLRAIVAAHSPGPNRHVRPLSGPNNPDFVGDQGYSSALPFPPESTRLLALFRYWNMVQYYFPYRDMMDRDWLDVLPELIPRFLGATNALEYHLAVAEMTASIDDGHAITESDVLDGYFGRARVPVDFRLVEGRTVITRVFPRLYDRPFDLRVGDVVTHFDGIPSETKRATLRRLLYGSNDATLERNIHETLPRTAGGRVLLTVESPDGRSFTWDMNAVTLGAVWQEANAARGAASAILPGNIGYVYMGWLQAADVAGVMAQLRDTRGIVFDLRSYPRGTLYRLSNYLNPASRPFATFQEPDYDYPGRLVWTPPYFAGPGSPGSGEAPPFTYTGRVAALVNEETLSYAEFSVMALQTAPAATVIGSQTAGADGNVSIIHLPGQITTHFTGIGVFYPDRTPTQRVGIVPDIVVRPTIRGLREGRDEVLEAALAFLR